MNRLFLLATLLLLCALAGAQTTVPRRGMVSVLAGYGVSATFPQPTVTVLNGPYQLKAENVQNPECYDDAGHLVPCNGTNRQLSLGLQYRLTDRSRTAGWMLFASVSMQEQTFTLNYPASRGFRIPVNCTPSIRRHLLSTGASVSLGRFWDIQGQGLQWFARLGVMMNRDFRYLRGTNAVPLPDPQPLTYVSGNSGTIIGMYPQAAQQNWLITPEIGLTSSEFPIELAASVHLPVVQPTVFSELHSFVENGRIVGQNRVDYQNAVFMLTARLGFNLTGKTRRTRTPRTRPEPAQEPPKHEPTPVTPDPVPVHQSAAPVDRFADLPVNKPIRLLVNFDQSKADLLPESHTDLDELARWLTTNPGAEIRLEGHTDLIGDEAENMDLSRRRVSAVKKYLSGRGIVSFRVETAYFGGSRPLNRDCPPPYYCPENRRVEMVIKKR